jgi:hypothetical protein
MRSKLPGKFLISADEYGPAVLLRLSQDRRVTVRTPRMFEDAIGFPGRQVRIDKGKGAAI